MLPKLFEAFSIYTIFVLFNLIDISSFIAESGEYIKSTISEAFPETKTFENEMLNNDPPA